MIKRQYIDNPAGGQIHVAEAGNKSSKHPSILLLHQTPRSWDEFKEVMGLLRTDCHLIAMDLPGMGASSPVSNAPTIEDYARAAAIVIRHFGYEAMTICGHHTGGVVAIDLAASEPKLVDSLALSSTPWLDSKTRMERSRKTPIDTATATRDGYHLIDYWRQRSPYYPSKTEFMNRFIADALKATNPATGHIAVGQYHMEQAVSKIECPVLLIEHMKDPFAVKHTPHLKADFPHAVIEYIPNGQVALEVTAPEFSAILHNWVFRTRKPGTAPALKVIK